MPNFKSNPRKQQESKVRDLDPQYRSKVRHYDIDVLTTGLVNGDTIELIALEGGDVVLGASTVTYEALGASTTVAIGIAGTAGKYLAATSTASAGTTSLQAGLVDRTRITAGAGETLFLTIGGANPTTAKKIKVSLLVSGV
jgi:hypothetical protein